MDETAICNDMISEITVEKRGAHTVHLKTTVWSAIKAKIKLITQLPGMNTNW